MNFLISLSGYIYSLFYNLFKFHSMNVVRFAGIPNIKADKLVIEGPFFAGAGLYIRGNQYSNIHIESEVLFGPQVMILGGNHISDNVTTHMYHIDEHDESSRDVIVHQGAWIGARSILLSGAEIGEGTIVGCNSVVNKQLLPYCIYAGSPAKLVRPRFSKSELTEVIKNVNSKLKLDEIPHKL